MAATITDIMAGIAVGTEVTVVVAAGIADVVMGTEVVIKHSNTRAVD